MNRKQLQAEALYVKDLKSCENLKETFKGEQLIQFDCKACGKTLSRKLRNIKIEENFLCGSCKRRLYFLKHFGVENASQLESVKDKKKQTCLKHFGVDHPFKNNQIQNKRRATNLERYGHENWFCTEAFKGNPEIKLKRCQTNKARFGTDWYSQSIAYKEALPSIRAKVESTNIGKTGYKCALQDPSVREKLKYFGKYYFGNQAFDSSWELALWIYAKDHDEEIERELCYFEYEYENKKHKYFPDFKYLNRLIEIKGNQFLTESGEVKNPFGAVSFIEAKLECAKGNSVEIWGEKDIQFALKYVKTVYGKDFLKKLRKEKC